MKTIKRITIDTIDEFAKKIEQSKENFIPMLPFVRLPFHDFERYKQFSEKGIYLIDYIGNDYCLYHLYHLTEGDDTLRATLILPSSWEKRFEIIEQSIPNVKEWFLKEDKSQRFIIQSLEYGEVEYFPTLSHYLIPTIIRNGFEAKYRMYMKREANQPLPQIVELGKDQIDAGYSKEMLEEVTDFYFHNEATKNVRYFTNVTYEEFLEIFGQDFTVNNSRFIKSDQGRIISGILLTKDSDKVWIDNYTVVPEYDDTDTGRCILSRTVNELSNKYPEETIYIYLNRDCHNAVKACAENGFVPFEFWTDMILDR